MVAYEYYWRDTMRGYELVGVLPERRKNTERVSAKSIMGFGRKFWGNKVGMDDILFVRISIDEKTGEVFRPKPPLGFDFED